MTKVCPHDTQASAAASRPTFWKLVAVRNVPDVMANTTIMTTRAAGRPTWRKSTRESLRSTAGFGSDAGGSGRAVAPAT